MALVSQDNQDETEEEIQMTQQIRNAINIQNDFAVGSHSSILAGNYSVIFSKAGDSMTLLPITLSTPDASGYMTADGDDNGTVFAGIDPTEFAAVVQSLSGGGDVVTSIDAGYIPNNVKTVSAMTQFTSSSGGTLEIGAGSWAVLPSSTGFALHQLSFDDNNNLTFMDGGDVIDGFTVGDIFTLGLESHANITGTNSTVLPQLPGGGVSYELVAHYQQTQTDMGGGVGLNANGEKVADGVSYKVYEITTDILGNSSTQELSASDLTNQGITVTASEYISGQDGNAITDTAAFFNDASNEGKAIKFSMSRTEGQETYDMGYNTIQVDATPREYVIQSRTGFKDNPFTAGDESSGILVSVIDMFDGDTPDSMAEIGMKLNVYNSDESGHDITGTSDFVPGGQDVTETSVMFYTKDYAKANMFMSLVKDGDDYNQTVVSNEPGKLANMFHKHDDGDEGNGAPKGVADLLSSGTKGVTDDDVVVGSNQGNVFNLNDGTTSDYTDATFNDGMDGEGVGFDFTGTDYTDDLGDSDYVAFGNDGDDFATGINDGDVFIGGGGHDTAVFDGEFQDYTFNIATQQQFDIAVKGNGVDLVIDDNSYLTSADASTIIDALIDPSEVWSISTGGESGTMSFVQSEEMFFAGDPGLNLSSADVLAVGAALDTAIIDELDAAGVDVSGLSVGDTATAAHSMALGKAELTEKTNDSDDYQIHTIELDVGESGEGGYGEDQTLFWEIEANGGDGQASLDDFVETSGYVDVAAGDETAVIDLKVINDGDQDEVSENFALKIGYVIGDNEVTTLDFSTAAYDGEIDMTDSAVGEVDGPTGNPYVALKAEGGNDVNITGGTDTIVVTSTDSNGQTKDITTLGADGKLSASDLAFAAASGNVFLAQETISATIASDPVEYYVYSGHNMKFSGTDFKGNTFVKEVSKSDDASITFNTITEAMAAAASNDSLTEIRISNDHHESEDITITVDNLLIDFWSTEAMAGPVVESKPPEILEVTAADVTALTSALGADAPQLAAGDNISFTDDGKMLIVDSTGALIGNPVVLSDAQKANLETFEERAELQGSVDTAEIIALGQDDAAAINSTLNLSGAEELGAGEKVTFSEDGKTIMIVNEQGDLVRPPLELTDQEATQLENYANQAELQGSVNNDAIINLDSNDASAINTALGLTGAEELVAGEKITFSEDGKTLMLVNETGDVIAPPVTLTDAQQQEIGAYADKAEIQGDLRPEGIIQLSDADATAISGVLELAGGEALVAGEKVAFNDDGTQMVVIGANDEIIGGPITLTTGQVAFMQNYADKAELQVKAAELEGDIQKEEIITIDATDASAVNNVLGLTGGDALAADTKITFSEDGETMLIVNDAGEVLGDPIVLDQAKQNALNDYADRAEQQGSLNQDEVITVSSSDATAINQALGLTGPDIIIENDTITITDDGKMLVIDQFGELIGNPIPLNETQKTALASIEAQVDSQGQVAELEGGINKEEIITIDAGDATAVSGILGLTGNDALAPDTKITFSEDGETMLIVNDNGEVVGDPIALDAAKQNQLNDYASRAELQGSLEDSDTITLDATDAQALNDALGNDGRITENARVTFSEDGSEMFVLDTNGKVMGQSILLDETKQNAIKDYADKVEIQSSLNDAEVVKIDATDAAVLNAVLGAEIPGGLAADANIAFNEDGTQMVVLDDQGLVVGAPITLDETAQLALGQYAEKAEAQGDIHDEGIIGLDTTEVAELNTALGLTGNDALAPDTKVTFTDDGKLLVLDANNEIIGNPITLDEAEKGELSGYIERRDTALEMAGVPTGDATTHGTHGTAAAGSGSKATGPLVFKLGDGIKNVYFGGSRDINVYGNDEDNIIVGNQGNNKIFGRTGNDVLLGYGGDDVIKGGSGDDFVDGMEGADRVYGQRGDDTLVATGSFDGEYDEEAQDLLSGGSGNDTLIDAANKDYSGQTSLLGGSGADTFSIGVMHHDLDFSTGAPVETWDHSERNVKTHLADLTSSDSLDFLALMEIAPGEGETAIAMDIDGDGSGTGTRISLDSSGSVASIDLSSGEGEVNTLLSVAEGLAIDASDLVDWAVGDIITDDMLAQMIAGGAPTTTIDAITAGTTTITQTHIDLMDEDAPMLNLSGQIGISHATETTIVAALTTATVKSAETAFGSADSGGAMDHYGITDDLTWVSEV